VIVFVSSPRAHWINGRNMPVDGLEAARMRRSAVVHANYINSC
jgi:hypothetical protein